MKKIYTSILLMIIATGFAQIPAGYYNTATGTGYTLKTQLYNIIKNHTDQGYAGLYVTYVTSDRDYYYENDGTILDMYSEKPAGADAYEYSATNTGDRCGNYSGEGDCFNREHLIPQSVFGSATPMYSDAHFVVPSDGSVNGARGNLPFGVVATPNYTSTNGSKRGPNLNSGYSAGYSGTVFEPIDEFKGDLARMYFYFATRYQNVVSGFPYDMFNGTNNQVFTSNAINILLTWANQDPVSAREIARNNAVYNRQNNRNPYIDHPEYAMEIWGSLLATPTFNYLDATAVYPNPSSDHKINVSSEAALEEIDLISINGQIVQQIKNPVSQNNTYVLENLPQGFYFLKLMSGNESVTKKIMVN
jgi:endonuclease I